MRFRPYARHLTDCLRLRTTVLIQIQATETDMSYGYCSAYLEQKHQEMSQRLR
jgi:hypothetical protein